MSHICPKKSIKTNYFITGMLVALLSSVIYLIDGGVISVFTLIVQIGLFSALVSTGFSVWMLLVPPISYGIGYLFTNDFALAALGVFYLPAAVVVGISLHKNFSRGITVVLSSLVVGITALAFAAEQLLEAGINLSFSEVSAFTVAMIEDVSSHFVSNIPDSLFTNDYSKEMYLALLKSGIKQFFIGFFVIICNVIAFASTAVTRRAVCVLECHSGALSVKCKEWLFELSKPSAIVYVIAYLCLIVGGDTLTLSQAIGFNTIMVAIQCGLFVMAFRRIKENFRVAGFSSLIVYFLLFYFANLQGVAIMLSITGMIAVFKQRSKGDVKS